MQVLFLAILVLAVYVAYTKFSKKTTKQEVAPEKIEPIVEVKVEKSAAPVESVKPAKAAKKPAAKKPAAKKPADKKPVAKKPAKAETTKAKKAKK